MDGSGKTDGANSTYQWVGEINAAPSVDELAGFCSFSVKTVQIVSSLEPRIWWEVRSSPSSTIINLCLCCFFVCFFGGLNCCTYLLPFGLFSLGKLVNRDQPGKHNKVKTDERLRVPRQRDLGKDSNVTKTFVQRRMV